MIQVLTDKCQHLGNSMVVVIAGQDVEELTSLNSRREVMKYARAQGFPASGLGGLPNPYPVDADGNDCTELLSGKRPVKHWQADYQVNAANA